MEVNPKNSYEEINIIVQTKYQIKYNENKTYTYINRSINKHFVWVMPLRFFPFVLQ